MRRLFVAAALAAAVTFAVAITSPAFADADPTVDQIYAAARSGHLDQSTREDEFVSDSVRSLYLFL